MFGPFRTSTVAASASGVGGISPATDASSDAGHRRSGATPAFRGSVIRPVSAEAAAVSGEQR